MKMFDVIFLFYLLTAMNFYSCRYSSGERPCPRSATALHSVVVDQTPNLPTERRTLYHWAIAAL